MLNIFSLQVYKKTVLRQIFFDTLAIIGHFASIVLLFRYNEKTAEYGLYSVILYTVLRTLYLVIIFFQIFFFKQFRLLFSFVFSVFFVYLLFLTNFMLPAISTGEPPTKHIYKQK